MVLAASYLSATLSTFQQCGRDPPLSSSSLTNSSVADGSLCYCEGGFLHPPSLTREVLLLEGAMDCSSTTLAVPVLQKVLLALYCLGLVLTVVAIGVLGRQLKRACGKSGVYTVSKERCICPSSSFSPPLPSSSSSPFSLNHRSQTSFHLFLHHHHHHHLHLLLLPPPGFPLLTRDPPLSLSLPPPLLWPTPPPSQDQQALEHCPH